MTDNTSTDRRQAPVDAASEGRRAAGQHHPRLLAYVTVAVVSAGLGAGAVFVGVRGRLAPVAGAAAPASHASHAASPDAGAAPSTPTGRVYISPARQQLIGVRTEEVVHRALETTIRTTGTLAYDETRVAQVHTKVAGWIERLDVDFVGKRVRRGQPLFAVYSPELVATQQEYLLALRARDQLGASVFAETRAGAASLVAAARERLRLWDVSEAQIAELERTGQPSRTVTLYSPFDGVVLERNAFAGQYLTPEMAAFKIADLSVIWALGSVFESELPMVRLGQAVEVVLPYADRGRTLRGTIAYVYPDVDPMARRARVRVEFRNPGFELKPESYVTMVMHASAGYQLAVPKEAVIDTGAKRYVLVAHADGSFEPREIDAGPPVDDFYPVAAGLAHGDRVVTSAQFLVDSETNLQAAMQAMVGHGHEAQRSGAVPAPDAAAPPNRSIRGATPPPVDHPQHKN